MKNLRKCTMLSLLLFLFAIITSACGSGGGGNGGEFMYLPNFVTLSKDKFEINIGQKDKVTAYIGGIDITKDATFEIVTESNQKDTVATIDNDGTITAIAVGTANIKVSYKQAESANFNVLVKDPTIPNTEVKTNDIYYELGDDTKDINKIVVTVNGKDKTNEAQFFSSDESVVKVDRNGNITFVGEGTATIIVHVEGANDSIINIEVQKPQLDISIDETKIELGIDNKEFYIELGETEQLTVKLRDEDKTSQAKYTSSDPSVVTVDENGSITAIKEGEAEITVIVDGAKEAKIPVVVPHQGPVYPQAGLKILLGNTDKLDILLRGENVTSQCPLNIHKMHEDDPDIITIDENGNITSLATGEIFITTSCNGDEITIPIKVYDELTTVARNDSGEIIQEKTKYINDQNEIETIKTILHDTGIIENKDDIQKVIEIDNIDDLNNLNINIDLEDGTNVAIVHRQEDGTLKYIATETIQDKKITKNDIDTNNIQEIAFNVLLGNTTLPFEIEPYEIVENDEIVTIDPYNKTIKADKTGTAVIKTTYNGQETFIRINVYDDVATTATNSAEKSIEVNSKILSAQDTEIIQTILHDTGLIENKNDIQKVIQIDNIDDLNTLDIDIDLEDGTTVAIIHKQEDGTLKYISTETVQGKKITKNDIDAEQMQDVAFNIMLGNNVPFEIEPHEVFVNMDNNGIISINNGIMSGDKAGNGIVKTTYNGKDAFIKINVYDTLTTNATNSAGEPIEVNTKILSPADCTATINLLYDTGMIASKNDVQKVIAIDNIDDLNSLDVDIDLEDGTNVAIVHRQQDGTLKYISTETVQGKKITKNDIDTTTIKEVAFNIMLENTKPFELNPYTVTQNNGVVTINDNNKTIRGNIPGTATITTTINGEDIIVKANVYDNLTTTAVDSNGQPVDVNAKILSETEKNQMITRLLDTGMISNENDIDEIVQIDSSNNIKTVTIDVDEPDGTQVSVIVKEDNKIKYVTTETVQDGKITVEVEGTNIVQVATINPSTGQTTTTITAGFYDDTNRLIASWNDVVSWGWQYGTTWDHTLITTYPNHFYNIMANHPDLANTTKLVVPEGITSFGGCTFNQCAMPMHTIVLPNSYTNSAIAASIGTGGLPFTNFVIRSDNPHFDSIDGVIYTEDHKTLCICPTNKTKVRVLDSCTKINGFAFAQNQSSSVGPLDSGADILVPNSVNTLDGSNNFAGMPNLKWVELWDGLVNAYLDPITSGNIQSVYIPSSVTTMTSGNDHGTTYSFAYAASNATLYIERTSKPSGWASLWIYRQGNGVDPAPVVWGVSRATYRANNRYITN